MDEQKPTDPQEQEQERTIDDLEVPDEQQGAVKGGLADSKHKDTIHIES